ncbi:phytoene/squalene synthase family protein [soil metagenome]
MNDTLRSSYRFCNDLARREARNFYYSFRLLPAERRRSMCALYAFMRRTDDLADEPGEATAKRSALLSWREELDRALDGDPSGWPGLPALADTVVRHSIPPRHLHEVIEGVEMDLQARSFATFDDLYGYCYHVASAVGLCCIHIWGYRSEGGRAERLAESCGIALQLTNILRDVREDAQAGRIYLPQEEMERFGVTPEALKATRPSDRVRELFAFQGRRAYDYYGQASPLMGLIEPVGRPVLAAITGIYRALLDEIARRDYDVLSTKVRLSAWKKSAITIGALVGPTRERYPNQEPEHETL